MKKLFLSHRLDLLAKYLSNEIKNDGLGIFSSRLIMVPNNSFKQWILIEIANSFEEKVVAGCKVMTLQEIVHTYVSPSKYTDVFFALFHLLENTENQEISNFLNHSPRKATELSDQLARLFLRYGIFCPALFKLEKNTTNWQKALIRSIFISGKLRLPAQMEAVCTPPVHCFGFDYLPPLIWKLFDFQSVYLFSPCRHYWEDLCTDRERTKFLKYWEKRGVSIEETDIFENYLKEAPPLLSNWGRAGREMLKIVDQFEWDIIEDYSPYENQKDCSLSRLRQRLLDYKASAPCFFSEDASIQISKTGSSLLKEIEHLRTSILRLMAQENLQFSDIAVFAPDIQLYASLIAFVFSELPFKISSIDIGTKSSFYQGLHCFFALDFELDGPALLFENRSFYQARGWDLETLQQIRKWDPKERLLDRFVFLNPKEKKTISNSSADLLGQFLDLYQSLKKDHALLKTSRTLLDWVKFLTQLVEKYFFIDFSNEADAASWKCFQQTLKELTRIGAEDRVFPFAPIQALLKRAIPDGQIKGSHLHAIRFASLAEGALVPVRALFLIGMDEDRFPRKISASSLDLSQQELVYLFDSSDQDRYLFLRAIFAAQDFFYMSYSHLSSDGHLIGPSRLVEEFSRSLDAPMREHTAPIAIEKIHSPFSPMRSQIFSPRPIAWPDAPFLSIPNGEYTISLSDLAAVVRHPWEFYLKKKLGIRCENLEEISFSQQRAKLFKEALHTSINDLSLPPLLGIYKDALKMELEQGSKKWGSLIQSWGLVIEPASFKICAREKRRLETKWEFPAIELMLSPSLRVRLVGEIKNFSTKGFIHTGNDQLEGLLKAWPECLMSLFASGSHEIYFLKTGRIKSVEKPLEALRAFMRYYFLCLSAPSPLLTSWADSILRQGAHQWERKVQDKLLGRKQRFEDRVAKWVMERVSLPPTSVWFENWSEELHIAFKDLLKSSHALL